MKQALIIPYGGKELVESTVRSLDVTMRARCATCAQNLPIAFALRQHADSNVCMRF